MARKLEHIGTIVQSDYHRIEDKRNRTKVEIATADLSVGGSAITLHTVTAGSVFFLTDIIISYRNTNGLVSGNLQIRDSGTLKVPFTTSVSSGNLELPKTFKTEPEFSTDLEIIAISGNFTVSLHLIGYEEPMV